jgi:hypothetical protein
MDRGQDSNFFAPYGKVIKYEDFHQYENTPIVDFIRRNGGTLFVLYPAATRNDGHWIALFLTRGDRNGEAVVEFFDPYGLRIEQQWEYTADKQTRSLARMLAVCPIPVVYNERRVQEMRDNMATCGYHCVLRAVNHNKTLYEYIAALNASAAACGVTKDEFVFNVFN